MYNIGDTIIYSSHGLCQIDGISEKTFSGVTKTYYVLHPLNNEKLEISTPVDNKTISTLMAKEEAEEILNLFTQPGVEWIDKGNQRTQGYSLIAKKGDRKELAKVINTLLVKKNELENNDKKFPEQDRKLLISMQSILFSELALALDTTTEDISGRIQHLLGIDGEVLLTNE
ncbi:CarD family transcriptional regulator [Ureibacillus chungkukjangi]|uniref:CarD family transcriptional regulator n=1 Tax=Ureibacillus chungkukjangi TaxID=1202712 RepID=A0A318TX89_9BACL|nr:CarD family transcriptional regulator [Ureibacillus chungkukjangi]MCM3387521.1 CarD family transcriptional regulator [Ureibacillus chungkukjangi]PYF08993.1 CarD family transcriptional regulator [Ureibacillus chungkukjangi]